MVKEISPILAEFEVETITHALVGGYDASPYSVNLGIFELPRAQALKGMWRWWLRALIGGALWEAGLRNRKELEDRIREEVRKILGSTKQASKLLFHVGGLENISSIKISAKALQELRNEGNVRVLPARMVLLQMGQPSEQAAARISCIKPGSKFNVIVKKRPYAKLSEPEGLLALWSLTLSLILGGIGAATRRGFGALKVKIKTKYDSIARKIEELNEANDSRSIKGALTSMIDSALSSTRDFLGVSRGRETRELPPFPVLTHPASLPFRLDVCQVSSQREDRELKRLGFKDEDLSAITLLKKLGKATLVASWRKVGHERGYIKYHTWIMGLPRKGYKPPERRASAIYLRPLKHMDETAWAVVVYGFVSRDWPKMIKLGREEINTTKKELIEQAFNQAWNIVIKILSGDTS